MAVVNCVFCGHDKVKVLETTRLKGNHRFYDVVKAIAKRRRVCLDCGKRFTTYEITEMELEELDRRYNERLQ